MRADLLLLFAVATFLLLPSAASGDNRTILVVESYDPTFEWDIAYKGALSAALEPAYHLVSVAMDTKRKPPNQHTAMADKAWRAYQDLQPALVILGDDAALRLLTQRLGKTSTPVVYLGINNNPRAYFDPSVTTNITGVLERPLIKRNIASVSKLLPRTRRILFLLDMDTTSVVIKQEIFHGSARQDIEGIAVDVKMMASWQQWQEEVLAAERNHYDAIFLGPSQALYDASNQGQNSSQAVIRWTSEHAAVPLFGLWDFAVGADKAVGGLVLNGYEQGAAAAAIALKILGGTPPRNIYPYTAERGNFLFSRKQLQRFHITLPADIAEKSKFTD